MKKEVNFDEFKSQVLQVADNADKVDSLSFLCHLQNGQTIDYEYSNKKWKKNIFLSNRSDSLSFNKLNATLSIIYAFLSISAIVLTSIFNRSSSLFLILIYFCLAIAFSTFLAINNLSNLNQRGYRISLFISRLLYITLNQLLFIIWYHSYQKSSMMYFSFIFTLISLQSIYMQTKGSLILNHISMVGLGLTGLIILHYNYFVALSFLIMIASSSISIFSILRKKNEFSAILLYIFNLFIMTLYFSVKILF